MSSWQGLYRDTMDPRYVYCLHRGQVIQCIQIPYNQRVIEGDPQVVLNRLIAEGRSTGVPHRAWWEGVQ